MQPSGKCDSKCGKKAKYWYFDTSAATCGDNSCVKIQDEKYQEHCKKIDEDNDFRNQMEEEFGEDWKNDR